MSCHSPCIQIYYFLKEKKTPFASNNYFNKVPHNKWIKSYLNAFEF